MKISRKQLRRLIREAFKQKIPMFGPDMFDVEREKGRQDADLSGLSPGAIENLERLGQVKPQANQATANQVQHLYQSLGSTEPSVSAEQELDFLAKQDPIFQDMVNYNLNQAFEDIFVNDNRNPALLKQLGFTAVKDYPQFQQGVKAYEDYLKDELKAKAKMLEKPESDMMIIDDHNNEEMFDKIYTFLQRDSNVTQVAHPKNMYAGQNVIIYMAKKRYPRGKKTLVDYGGGLTQIIL